MIVNLKTASLSMISTAAPDIPTVDEAGLPGFYFSAWYALWAPKATPRSVISRLNSVVVEALATTVATTGQAWI
jgi:tripartite-type tricarboxylate transporter receptor subunit TctC